MNDLNAEPIIARRTPRQELDELIKTLEFKSAEQLTGSDVADAFRVIRDMFDNLTPPKPVEQPPVPGL